MRKESMFIAIGMGSITTEVTSVIRRLIKALNGYRRAVFYYSRLDLNDYWRMKHFCSSGNIFRTADREGKLFNVSEYFTYKVMERDIFSYLPFPTFWTGISEGIAKNDFVSDLFRLWNDPNHCYQLAYIYSGQDTNYYDFERIEKKIGDWSSKSRAIIEGLEIESSLNIWGGKVLTEWMTKNMMSSYFTQFSLDRKIVKIGRPIKLKRQLAYAEGEKSTMSWYCAKLMNDYITNSACFYGFEANSSANISGNLPLTDWIGSAVIGSGATLGLLNYVNQSAKTFVRILVSFILTALISDPLYIKWFSTKINYLVLRKSKLYFIGEEIGGSITQRLKKKAKLFSYEKNKLFNSEEPDDGHKSGNLGSNLEEAKFNFLDTTFVDVAKNDFAIRLHPPERLEDSSMRRLKSSSMRFLRYSLGIGHQYKEKLSELCRIYSQQLPFWDR